MSNLLDHLAKPFRKAMVLKKNFIYQWLKNVIAIYIQSNQFIFLRPHVINDVFVIAQNIYLINDAEIDQIQLRETKSWQLHEDTK